MQTRLLNTLVVALVGMLCLSSAHADSTPAQCGFSARIENPPEVTSACTFSQRQGFVSIYFADGRQFDFSPTEEAPGNFTDAEGMPVYRRSGLGKDGQVFRLPEQFLFVYWPRMKYDCSAEDISGAAGCMLDYGGLGFQVSAPNAGSLNQLSLQVTGLSNGARSVAHEVDGAVYRAELADLDANGWPEVYIYISSAGSGSYGSLVAYAVNTGRSISPIYLPRIVDNDAANEGYMGHDEFAVVETRLVRRFPVYRPGDTNREPTGGMRQLQYRLVAGEAGWQLEVDKVVEY